jgi:DNA-directed RNA polymerase subunit RPC12/RpoP
MSSHDPIELLVTCRGCAIENLIVDYTPGLPAVCSQCREKLIDMELMDSHKEVVCEDCGMTLLLPKDTEVTMGESTCRCGSSNLALQDSPSIPLLSEEAKASKKNEDEEPADDNFDWCRPAPTDGMSEDYNDVFDDDPGY